MVMGEITTKANIDVEKIVRDTIAEIGYTKEEYGFKENLHRYSVLSNDNDMNLRYIKVYIKCWEDYQKIRAICERNFDKNKIIYMQSDVCRQELLVEIEGVWS